jgi:hypothetical protein
MGKQIASALDLLSSLRSLPSANALASASCKAVSMSCWAGKQGAVCAFLSLGADQGVSFKPPLLANFDEALSFIRDQIRLHDYCLVAVDQPTIVPNETGCRPVDRVAASLISYMGGGVQPSNRKKHCSWRRSTLWRFKQGLGAHESPEESRSAENGLFIIEVFPALALAGSILPLAIAFEGKGTISQIDGAFSFRIGVRSLKRSGHTVPPQALNLCKRERERPAPFAPLAKQTMTDSTP